MNKRTREPSLLPPAAQPEGLIPPRLWILLAIVPVFLLFLASDFRPALLDSPYPDQRIVLDAGALRDRVRDGGPGLTHPQGSLRGPWLVGERGVDPDPEGEGVASVVLRVHPADWDRFEVRVDGDRRVEWGIRISWSEGDHLNRTLVSNTPVLAFRPGEVVEVTTEQVPGLLVASEPISVTLTPRTGSVWAPGRTPVLEGVRARATSDTLNRLPHLPDYAGMVLLPFLAALVLRVGFGFSAHRCFAGGLGFGILGFLLASGQADQGESGVVWAITLGAALAALGNVGMGLTGIRRHRRLAGHRITPGEWRDAAAVVGLMLVLAVAVGPAWTQFETARRGDLPPQGIALVEAATTLATPLAPLAGDPPAAIPPLAPWLMAGWLRMAPPSESAAHFLAMLVFVISCGLAFEAGRRVAGLVPGLVAAGVLVWWGGWTTEAMQAYLLDITLALALALVAAGGSLGPVPVKRAVAFAVMGGALVLSAPWTAVPLALVLVGTQMAARTGAWRWTAGELALGGGALVVAAGLVLAASRSSDYLLGNLEAAVPLLAWLATLVLVRGGVKAGEALLARHRPRWLVIADETAP